MIYNPTKAPIGLEKLRVSTYEQAELFFNHFNAVKTKRIQYLSYFFHSFLNRSIKWDYTDESLQHIWSEFNDIKLLLKRKQPKDYLETASYILYDIGIYFGETLSKLYKLPWIIYQNASSLNHHHPVLTLNNQLLFCPLEFSVSGLFENENYINELITQIHKK